MISFEIIERALDALSVTSHAMQTNIPVQECLCLCVWGCVYVCSEPWQVLRQFMFLTLKCAGIWQLFKDLENVEAMKMIEFSRMKIIQIRYSSTEMEMEWLGGGSKNHLRLFENSILPNDLAFGSGKCRCNESAIGAMRTF